MSSEAPNAPSQEDSSAPAQQKSTSPLQDALKDIQQAVDNAKKNALFPCGGKIKVDASSPESPHEAPAASQTNAGEQVPKEDHKEGKVPNNSKKEDKKDAATKENAIGPIVIRYDLNADHIAAARRITLPINGTAIALQGLIATCSPATFGHDGKDVYDETYRKALKMDNTAFCTTFGPYSLGIIRIIEKMLLPSVDDQNGWNRTVRAELYKMNIYSSPSGKFKAHVDTPRSPLQFGSLVACLSSHHERGALEVRHDAKSVKYDWGTNAAELIQWAAFYSDCDHEVFEVTSGHRITVTWNLFVEEGGSIAKFMSPKLPLYETVKQLMKVKNFMKRGGNLGFYCTHAYARTSNVPMRIASLKGIDMAMFYVLSALVFMPSLHPTLSLHLGELDMSDDYDEDEEDYEWDSENDEPRALPVPAEVGHFDHALEGTKFWPMKLGGGDMFNALVTTAMTVRRFGEALEAPSS